MDLTPEHGSDSASKRRLKSLILSMHTIMSLCAKQASRVSKKLKPKPTTNQNNNNNNNNNTSKISPLSPLRTAIPKQLLTSISNKAINYLNKKKVGGKKEDDEFGDGGVWQRAILMGDKCQPLDFSGVIYYDSDGKQLHEGPPLRSPRASPLPGYVGRI